MFKTHHLFTLSQFFASKPMYIQLNRSISALYITGDKATENYVTLQPYMDFEEALKDKEALKTNISQRRMKINLEQTFQKYETFKAFQSEIQQLVKKREEAAFLSNEAIKEGVSSNQCNELKDGGITLRKQLKKLKEEFYPIEDDFIHAYLNLPSKLHLICPYNLKEKILYRSSIPYSDVAETHLKRADLIIFLDKNCYYLLKDAAIFDIYVTLALAHHFTETGSFQQTANPDFVRCVLLEANATPLENYHLVKEEHLVNQINTAFLTGGGAFESFLGAITKLCIYPNVLPLRFVSTGRCYQKTTASTFEAQNLYTATQTNAVQTFVAAENAIDADQEMENILNICIDFYKTLNIHFRIIYADASALTPAECLRAVIEVYSPAQQRYICVGHVSNYSDFVSKRVLFTIRKRKDYHFLHLVGGPVLYTTRLIAVLIENGIPLADCIFLNNSKNVNEHQRAIDEFKNIFK